MADAVDADPRIEVLAWPARRKRRDNPYTYLLQEATAQHGVVTEEFGVAPLLRRRWDIIHIHWPDMILLRGGAVRQALTGLLLLVLLRLHRKLGARLVWTVHNLRPHEVRAPRVASWFMNSFAGAADGIISPSHAGLELALQAYPQLATKPAEVVPIGRYTDGDVIVPVQEARDRLSIEADAVVFLAFGMIRRYKNLPYLANQFRKLDEAKARLIIAGPPTDAGEVELLRSIAADDERIEIIAERIDDHMVPTFFGAADCFVAPFQAILNSGSLLLALAHECRAIVPAAGGLPEVARTVGPGWVSTFEGELTSDHLLAAVDAPRPNESPDLSLYDWDDIGCKTARFFEEIAGRTRSEVVR